MGVTASTLGGLGILGKVPYNRQASGFNIHSYESDCMNAWILKFLIVCMCMCVSSFVIFPVKIALTLISMLMYSCLHLTLNMLWLIIITQDERSEPILRRCLGLGTKGGQFSNLAVGPTIVIKKHLETGGVFCLLFFFSFFFLTFWKG